MEKIVKELVQKLTWQQIIEFKEPSSRKIAEVYSDLEILQEDYNNAVKVNVEDRIKRTKDRIREVTQYNKNLKAWADFSERCKGSTMHLNEIVNKLSLDELTEKEEEDFRGIMAFYNREFKT